MAYRFPPPGDLVEVTAGGAPACLRAGHQSAFAGNDSADDVAVISADAGILGPCDE